MNESVKTKKALRGSLVALFLCIILLIGTTFAWFTDTASTGVNKIQAGNLDVQLLYSTDGTNWHDAEGQTLRFLQKQADETVRKLCKYIESLHISDAASVSFEVESMANEALSKTSSYAYKAGFMEACRLIRTLQSF